MDAALSTLSLTETSPAAFHAASGYVPFVQATPSVESGVERAERSGGIREYHNAEGIQLLHGDCLTALRAMPSDSVDITVTSPPYNLGEGMEDKGGYRVAHKGSLWSGSRLRNGYATHDDAMPYAEYVAWQRAVLLECWRVTRGAIYYNHKPRVVKGLLRTPLELVGDLPVRQIVIWDRGSGFNFMAGAYVPQHEWIILLAKEDWRLRDKAASGAGDVWRFAPESGNDHPASFPLELPRTAMETSGAESVLDPFAGSGTTLVAARNLGRKAIGVELSEGYCALAVERLSMGALFCAGGGGAERQGEMTWTAEKGHNGPAERPDKTNA